MPSPDLRLGVDVGGTNTDAVVLDADDRLLAKAKVPTTPDVTSGHRGRDRRLVRAGRPRPDHARDVRYDARDERRPRATRSAARRRAAPRRPGDARDPPAVRLARRPARGRSPPANGSCTAGSSSTGASSSPLDAEAVARFAGEVAGRADAIAIASVFAPVSDEHERAAEEIDERSSATCRSRSAPRSGPSACSSARTPPS